MSKQHVSRAELAQALFPAQMFLTKGSSTELRKFRYEVQEAALEVVMSRQNELKRAVEEINIKVFTVKEAFAFYALMLIAFDQPVRAEAKDFQENFIAYTYDMIQERAWEVEINDEVLREDLGRNTISSMLRKLDACKSFERVNGHIGVISRLHFKNLLNINLLEEARKNKATKKTLLYITGNCNSPLTLAALQEGSFAWSDDVFSVEEVEKSDDQYSLDLFKYVFSGSTATRGQKRSKKLKAEVKQIFLRKLENARLLECYRLVDKGNLTVFSKQKGQNVEISMKVPALLTSLPQEVAAIKKQTLEELGLSVIPIVPPATTSFQGVLDIATLEDINF